MLTPDSDVPKSKGRLLLGTTVPWTAEAFLAEQTAYLASRGWDIHLVTSPGGTGMLDAAPHLTLHVVPMKRLPSLRTDLQALIRWLSIVRSVKPDVAMIGTPKAGLLGLLAARLCRVPHRVYLMRGLRLEGLKGTGRALSLFVERITCWAADWVVCVSPSLRAQLLALRISRPDRTIVLGPGSSNGVDTHRFHPASSIEDRLRIRRSFGLADDALIVGFVGRLTADKGIEVLVHAVERARARQDSHVMLLVVGDIDEARPLPPQTMEALAADWVIRVGHMEDTAPAYRAMDVFAFPSEREGFPNAALEAASSGLPVITTDATGCIDAVENGVTGMIVNTGSVGGFADSIATLATNQELRQTYGRAGRDRVRSTYRNDLVWERTDRFLDEISSVK